MEMINYYRSFSFGNKKSSKQLRQNQSSNAIKLPANPNDSLVIAKKNNSQTNQNGGQQAEDTLMRKAERRSMSHG